MNLTKEAIGTAGLTISNIGFGGAPLGNLFAAIPEDVVQDSLDAAFNAGIRYFDTAPLYGFGLSESRYGQGLAAYERDQLAISSKVGYTLRPLAPGEAPPFDQFVDAPPMTVEYDYSRDAVLRSIEGSLQRLQTDRIDLIYIHDPDEGVSLQRDFDPYEKSHLSEVMEQTYPVLDELRSQNVIKAIGVGMNQWQMLADFAAAGDFDCFLLAGRYTLLEQESLEKLLPLCEQRGVRIVIGGPYNSGILATGPVEGACYNYALAPVDILERTREIEAVCKRHAVPLAAAALQFPLAHPVVAAIIPGARSPDELNANVQLCQFEIPADLWVELKAEQLIHVDAPVPG
jgi:D-threo-aldose 1-dehydrogenase